MIYTMTAEIELPGLNQYLRTNRFVRVRMKKALAVELGYTCTPRRPLEPLPKASLRVEMARTRLLDDADNIYGCLKILGDALVQAGLIADDSTKVIGYPEVTQKTLKEAGVTKPQVTVWLEEA